MHRHGMGGDGRDFEGPPVHETSSYVARFHKRPQTTSTNAARARRIFGNPSRMELDISVFIDDYNHNMNGVHLANQLRQSYDTQLITYHTV